MCSADAVKRTNCYRLELRSQWCSAVEYYYLCHYTTLHYTTLQVTMQRDEAGDSAHLAIEYRERTHERTHRCPEASPLFLSRSFQRTQSSVDFEGLCRVLFRLPARLQCFDRQSCSILRPALNDDHQTSDLKARA